MKTASEHSQRATTRGRRFPPEPLTRSEVEALLRRCSRRAPTGVRNRALIAVLYRSGLRISEALALRPVDVDPVAGSINVLHGKGDRSRIVGLDAGGFELLQRWLELRAKLGLGRAERIFCTLQGTPLHATYVREMLHRKGRQAGIVKRVHPHGLRHTHAVELRRERVDLEIIRRQLGHSSLDVTSRYLHHVAPQEVIDTVRRREWDVA